jgi:hypothetical protein
LDKAAKPAYIGTASATAGGGVGKRGADRNATVIAHGGVSFSAVAMPNAKLNPGN